MLGNDMRRKPTKYQCVICELDDEYKTMSLQSMIIFSRYMRPLVRSEWEQNIDCLRKGNIKHNRKVIQSQYQLQALVPEEKLLKYYTFQETVSSIRGIILQRVFGEQYPHITMMPHLSFRTQVIMMNRYVKLKGQKYFGHNFQLFSFFGDYISEIYNYKQKSRQKYVIISIINKSMSYNRQPKFHSKLLFSNKLSTKTYSANIYGLLMSKRREKKFRSPLNSILETYTNERCHPLFASTTDEPYGLKQSKCQYKKNFALFNPYKDRNKVMINLTYSRTFVHVRSRVKKSSRSYGKTSKKANHEIMVTYYDNYRIYPPKKANNRKKTGSRSRSEKGRMTARGIAQRE